MLLDETTRDEITRWKAKTRQIHRATRRQRSEQIAAAGEAL